jgi:hypothetical protein
MYALALPELLYVLMSCMPSAGEGEEDGGGSSPGKEGKEKAEQDANANPNPFGFPLSLVKRVMCLDPEVSASRDTNWRRCHVCCPSWKMKTGRLLVAWQPRAHPSLEILPTLCNNTPLTHCRSFFHVYMMYTHLIHIATHLICALKGV